MIFIAITLVNGSSRTEKNGGEDAVWQELGVCGLDTDAQEASHYYISGAEDPQFPFAVPSRLVSHTGVQLKVAEESERSSSSQREKNEATGVGISSGTAALTGLRRTRQG